MKQHKSLKDQNNPAITAYWVVNLITLYIFIDGSIDALATLKFVWPEIAGTGAIGILTRSFTVDVLNSFLKRHQKESLIFWRRKHGAPGYRAFSELAPKHGSVSVEALESRHGKLPNEPMAQNELWTAISRKHGEDIRVRSAHRRWLLVRDLAAPSFATIFVAGLLAPFSTRPMSEIIGFLAAFAILHYAIRLSAINESESFVTIVLTTESAEIINNSAS